jgi:hypothetical protein
MAIRFLQEMEKEPGKRNYVLSIMSDNRHKRPAVTGPEIGFIEFRNHLPGDIVLAIHTKDLFLECREA